LIEGWRQANEIIGTLAYEKAKTNKLIES